MQTALPPNLDFAPAWRPCRWDALSPPSLAPKEVHLWAIPLYAGPALARLACPDRLLGLLPAETLRRLQRLRDPALRNQRFFLHAHLGQILSAYLKLPPQVIPFLRSERGKPHIPADANPEGLVFNLSHSREIALLAIGQGTPLGVDIEFVDTARDCAALARRYFHPREIRMLEALPLESQHGAFYQCWTRKEAYLKAVGTGLSRALREVYVGWEAGFPLASPPASPSQSGEESPWYLHGLEVPGEYRAAVCTRHTWNKQRQFFFVPENAAISKS